MAQGGRRVRVGDGSGLEVGVLIVEQNFAEFSGEGARDHFGKRHCLALYSSGGRDISRFAKRVLVVYG
jgi:hypothetical protein